MTEKALATALTKAWQSYVKERTADCLDLLRDFSLTDPFGENGNYDVLVTSPYLADAVLRLFSKAKDDASVVKKAYERLLWKVYDALLLPLAKKNEAFLHACTKYVTESTLRQRSLRRFSRKRGLNASVVPTHFITLGLSAVAYSLKASLLEPYVDCVERGKTEERFLEEAKKKCACKASHVEKAIETFSRFALELPEPKERKKEANLVESLLRVKAFVELVHQLLPEAVKRPFHVEALLSAVKPLYERKFVDSVKALRPLDFTWHYEKRGVLPFNLDFWKSSKLVLPKLLSSQNFGACVDVLRDTSLELSQKEEGTYDLVSVLLFASVKLLKELGFQRDFEEVSKVQALVVPLASTFPSLIAFTQAKERKLLTEDLTRELSAYENLLSSYASFENYLKAAVEGLPEDVPSEVVERKEKALQVLSSCVKKVTDSFSSALELAVEVATKKEKLASKPNLDEKSKAILVDHLDNVQAALETDRARVIGLSFALVKGFDAIVRKDDAWQELKEALLRKYDPSVNACLLACVKLEVLDEFLSVLWEAVLRKEVREPLTFDLFTAFFVKGLKKAAKQVSKELASLESPLEDATAHFVISQAATSLEKESWKLLEKKVNEVKVIAKKRVSGAFARKDDVVKL